MQASHVRTESLKGYLMAEANPVVSDNQINILFAKEKVIKEIETPKADRIDLYGIYKKLSEPSVRYKDNEQVDELFVQSRTSTMSSLNKEPKLNNKLFKESILENHSQSVSYCDSPQRRSSLHSILTQRKFSKPEQNLSPEHATSFSSKLTPQKKNQFSFCIVQKTKCSEGSASLLSPSSQKANIKSSLSRVTEEKVKARSPVAKQSPTNKVKAFDLARVFQKSLKTTETISESMKKQWFEPKNEPSSEDMAQPSTSSEFSRKKTSSSTPKTSNTPKVSSTTPNSSGTNFFKKELQNPVENEKTQVKRIEVALHELSSNPAAYEVKKNEKSYMLDRKSSAGLASRSFDKMFSGELLQQEDLHNMIVPSAKSKFRYLPTYFKPISEKRMSQLMLDLSGSQQQPNSSFFES